MALGSGGSSYLYAWPLLTVLVLLFKRVIGESAIAGRCFPAYGLLFGLLYAGPHALCRRLGQYARRLDRRLPV